MNDSNLEELCLSLVRADTEAEVISMLRDSGYWDNHKVWRFYGDYENNFSTIGNQQGRPDAALVEKLINSVDARLINECLARGRVDPIVKTRKQGRLRWAAFLQPEMKDETNKPGGRFFSPSRG